MTSTLSRHSSLSLAQQLAQRVAEPIVQGLLAPGTRMPSVRECARRHGVSPYTVVAAYDQLQAQGLLEARRQRGFFVRDTKSCAQRTRHSPSTQGPVALHAPIDATALIRGMFQAKVKAAPGMGTLPVEWLDLPLLHAALRKVIALEDAGEQYALQYGNPAGCERLRKALALRIADHGINARPDQLLTTLGATHALDLITRTFLQPGDAVLVDDPGWAVEFARLSRAGMRLLPVPRGVDGPNLEIMAHLIKSHKPRMYTTVSVLHNPTGNSLSLNAAHQILRMAENANFMIVEDDSYSHLAPMHAPRLSALDGLHRTLYVSGFSKILTPGWRVGFVAGSIERIQQLTEAKMLSTLTTPPLFERAMAHCLERGQLRRHAERVQAHLTAARQRVVRLVHDNGFKFVSPPNGLFGWIDVGIDTDRLAQSMLGDGWLLAPGSLFSATRQGGTLMRINFASSQDAGFWKALVKAQAAIKPQNS